MAKRRADAGFEVDDLDNDAIVAELFNALDHTTLLAPITARVPSFGIDDAYQVSAQIAFFRRARGERPIGVVLHVQLHHESVDHAPRGPQGHAHANPGLDVTELRRERVVEQAVELRQRRLEEHPRDAPALRGDQHRGPVRARQRAAAPRPGPSAPT